MGLNNMGLGFVFTARDLASGKMQRLERRFTSLDERVSGGADRRNSALRQPGIGRAGVTARAAAGAGARVRESSHRPGLGDHAAHEIARAVGGVARLIHGA